MMVWDDIWLKLNYLDMLDRQRRVFGAAHHRYLFRPKLAPSDLDTSDLPLPQQLRDFYTHIGNGGAGPHYGILPLDKLLRYRPHKPYPGHAHYRELAKANDALWDDDDAYENGYFEINHDELSGLLGLIEVGCGHVVCIVSAGEQLGEMVHVSCDGFIEETGLDFAAFYAHWLEHNLALLERVKLLTDQTDMPLAQIVDTIRKETQQSGGHEVVMGVIGANVPSERLGEFDKHQSWCAEQLEAYRARRQWRADNPNRVLPQPFEKIPQFMEHPQSFERLAYKASSGSYKAPDMLQFLQRFVATAVLGGDPWADITSGEMEERLSQVYQQRLQPPADAPDVMAMAQKWAWAPLVGSWIHFEEDELMLGVEALCALLQTIAPEQVAARLATAYQLNDPTDNEFFELGRTLWYLGAQRSDLLAASKFEPAANNAHVVRGWQQAADASKVAVSPMSVQPAVATGLVSAETIASINPVVSAEKTASTNPAPPPPRQTLHSIMRGSAAGLVAGIVGGGLFGILVHIGEQFDGKYDEPSLWTIIVGAPLFALIGAIVGAPFGLVGGVLFGLIAPNRIAPEQAPRLGLWGGAVIGAGIGMSLQGVSFGGDWERLFWDLLLVAMGAVSGAAGGRVGGKLFRRLSSRKAS